MASTSDLETLLIVEGDKALGEVLSRVLSRRGFEIIRARSADQALEMAVLYQPRLALVDGRPRHGLDSKIIYDLQTRCRDLPVLVFSEQGETASQASPDSNHLIRHLTLPIELSELRDAVESALGKVECEVRYAGRGPHPECGARSVKSRNNAEVGMWNEDSKKSISFGFLHSALRIPHSALRRVIAKELVMCLVPVHGFKIAGVVVFLLVVLTGIGMFLGGIPAPWRAAGAEGPTKPITKKTDISKVELVRGKTHTLAVPEDARKALGISTPKGDFIAVAKKPTKPKYLVMPGSTMFDPTCLYRIRAPFAPSPSSAECVEIAKVRDESSPVSKEREIRSGDRVKKDDPLAVFHSVDVGNKKNDLIDAMYQLHLDKQILDKAEAHADSVPEVFLLNARRQVAGDQNNVNRSLATLRSWRISKEDIEKVQKEAEEVIKRGGKHDSGVDAKWPRVEIKAPDDGIIVERNLAIHEIIVDNTTNLFQIARLDRLAVLANCPEDDLPELEKLTTDQRQWTVRTIGSAPIKGQIDDISYIIDPNQHTAVVKGHIQNVKNKYGEEVLRAGQFIEATVELPAPADVVEIPMDAVSEDGQQAVVFVLTDAAKHQYTMRRVQLEARFADTAFVRSKPFDKSDQLSKDELAQGILPKEPLTGGELVLQTGVGELKAKLLDLESQPEKK